MIYYFPPEARSEHYETISFYESRSVGLGSDYLSAFEATMARIVEAPHRYKVERRPNIRRVSLARFPCKVIYRESEGSVQVLAVSHKRHRPGYWMHRL